MNNLQRIFIGFLINVISYLLLPLIPIDSLFGSIFIIHLLYIVGFGTVLSILLGKKNMLRKFLALIIGLITYFVLGFGLFPINYILVLPIVVLIS